MNVVDFSAVSQLMAGRDVNCFVPQDSHALLLFAVDAFLRKVKNVMNKLKKKKMLVDPKERMHLL